MIQQQNKETLARISAGLCFLHIWAALGYGWYVVLQIGFFGTGLASYLIAGAVLLLLVNPGTPWIIAHLVLQPIVHNALDRNVIQDGGCLSGLVVFLALIMWAIWALTRLFWTALLIFVAAPVMALVVAMIITYVFPLIRNLRLPFRRRLRP